MVVWQWWLAIISGWRQSLTPESKRRKCINSYVGSSMDLPEKIQKTSRALLKLPRNKLQREGFGSNVYKIVVFHLIMSFSFPIYLNFMITSYPTYINNICIILLSIVCATISGPYQDYQNRYEVIGDSKP